MPVPDADLEMRWGSWLLQRNRRGFRSALWIALVLFPLFGIVDWLIAPRAWLWLLWSTRAFVLLLTLAMFPVLTFMYVRLAHSEEREAIAEFDGAYAAYMRNVPGFIPRLARLTGSVGNDPKHS